MVEFFNAQECGQTKNDIGEMSHHFTFGRHFYDPTKLVRSTLRRADFIKATQPYDFTIYLNQILVIYPHHDLDLKGNNDVSFAVPAHHISAFIIPEDTNITLGSKTDNPTSDYYLFLLDRLVRHKDIDYIKQIDLSDQSEKTKISLLDFNNQNEIIINDDNLHYYGHCINGDVTISDNSDIIKLKPHDGFFSKEQTTITGTQNSKIIGFSMPIPL